METLSAEHESLSSPEHLERMKSQLSQLKQRKVDVPEELNREMIQISIKVQRLYSIEGGGKLTLQMDSATIHLRVEETLQLSVKDCKEIHCVFTPQKINPQVKHFKLDLFEEIAKV